MSVRDNQKQARRWKRKSLAAARREKHSRRMLSIQGDVLNLLIAKLSPDQLNSLQRSK